MVDPDIVHSIVDEHRLELPQAAGELIELANKNGGRDNISVIIVQVPIDFLPDDGWAKRFLAKKKVK